MDAEPDISQVGALLADRTRALFLDEIAARGPQTVGALARAAGVSPSVASQHVARLARGGLVTVAAVGRLRLVSIASVEVAQALEALSRVAPPRAVYGLREVGRASAFRLARSCYDHLAGRLGVGVLAGLEARGWLVATPHGAVFDLSQDGERALAALALDVAPLRRARRAFARGCLDCTERRPHLAGAVGAAMLDAFLERGWLVRGASRALSVTGRARAELPAWLGVDPLASDA